MRVSCEGKGIGLLERRGSVLLLNVVEVLFKVGHVRRPEQVAHVFSALARLHPQEEVANVLRRLWRELLLF